MALERPKAQKELEGLQQSPLIRNRGPNENQ